MSPMETFTSLTRNFVNCPRLHIVWAGNMESHLCDLHSMTANCVLTPGFFARMVPSAGYFVPKRPLPWQRSPLSSIKCATTGVRNGFVLTSSQSRLSFCIMAKVPTLELSEAAPLKHEQYLGNSPSELDVLLSNPNA